MCGTLLRTRDKEHNITRREHDMNSGCSRHLHLKQKDITGAQGLDMLHTLGGLTG